MCPNCKKDTFSAWDKIKSKKLRTCSECGSLVKPAFFRSALSLSIAILISTLCSSLTIYLFMKLIGSISFTYIWIIVFPLFIGGILPIIPWVKINDWFVPWVEQKV